ncbi:hypothetical protein HK097_007681 [Rhizophlyctis rosea]|uniref:DUF6593 domain-containing protein n=1 Tax=Rhizophlyctis rosea TaxID=64517 RepID=A0AAD5SEC9_9FUNG|nr:hypothetical protein HK097_007681 [Rhizophlyctis rosea]
MAAVAPQHFSYDSKPPAYTPTAGPLTFNLDNPIKKIFTTSRALEISTPDTLYPPILASFHSGCGSSPNIEFSKNSRPLATVNFHSFSSTTDIVFSSGLSTPLKGSAFSRKCTMNLSGREYTWKHHSEGMFHTGGWQLIDGGGSVVAYLRKKVLEVYVPGLPEEMLDAIVVTAVTMAEKERRAQQQSATSASAAAASSASASAAASSC